MILTNKDPAEKYFLSESCNFFDLNLWLNVKLEKNIRKIRKRKCKERGFVIF